MVLKLFCFLFLLGAPLITWGFSFEQVENLKKQSLELHLDQSPAWLRLGHYRKSWTGSYHSPILGNFFVAADGANNPHAELLATLDLLFADKTSQAQCRYLARTSWLKKQLSLSNSDLVTCKEREAWKKSLGATEAYLIFAASDLSSAPSSFGHTFLRLHNPRNTENLELLDYGVNYAAVTGSESGALYALKGIFGFYPGTYSMLPFHQKILEYSNLEGRDLWEYKLKLSPEQVEFMIDHLLEIEGGYAPYYFSDDNCSAQMLELMEVVSPESQLTSRFPAFVIPLDTVKALKNENLLSGEKLRVSLQTEWRARYAQLNLTERQGLRELVKDSERTEKYQTLSTHEKAETLEAALSYLSIQEYREHSENKKARYHLAVARAQLGAVTEPVTITPPKSPLLSPSSSAIYFGYGQDDHVDFYQFKFRTGFHDLLSDDSGLAPFSQLNFMSFDFHYRPREQNLDLHDWVILSILSTSPWTTLEKPLSWKFEAGTSPKLAPYVNGGLGFSADLPFAQATRWSVLAVSENRHLLETAQPFFGAETLLMNKWTDHWRTLLRADYLCSTSDGRQFPVGAVGISYDHNALEYRLEGEHRDNVDRWKFSVIF